MLAQPLLDKLTRLRLPAFRRGLEEQLTSSKYADLSFEERLAILIDLECMYRDNNRLERRLKKAQLHLPATIEDFDFSSARGIDKTLVLELAQGAWIANHLNAIVSGLRVRERHSSDVRWVIQCVGWISPCNISGYHVFCMISDWRMPMVLIPNC